MRRGRSGSRPGGPDAARATGSLNCGSLTGDSGAVGRRPRLTFWSGESAAHFRRRSRFKPQHHFADGVIEDSSSRGLTAIILRLRWSSFAAALGPPPL